MKISFVLSLWYKLLSTWNNPYAKDFWVASFAPDTDNFKALSMWPSSDPENVLLVPCAKHVLCSGASAVNKDSLAPKGLERYTATQGSWTLVTPRQDIGGILDQKWPGRIFLVPSLYLHPLLSTDLAMFLSQSWSYLQCILGLSSVIAQALLLSSFPDFISCAYCSVVFTLLEPLLSLFAVEAEYENATPKQWADYYSSVVPSVITGTGRSSIIYIMYSKLCVRHIGNTQYMLAIVIRNLSLSSWCLFGRGLLCWSLSWLSLSNGLLTMAGEV